jgi:flagellar hook-length control protein FliK
MARYSTKSKCLRKNFRNHKMQNLILQSAPSANKTSASDTLSGLSNTQSNQGATDVKQAPPLFASILKKQVGHHTLKEAGSMSDKSTTAANLKDKAIVTKPLANDEELSADADNVNLLELTTQAEPSIKTTAKAKSTQKDIEEAQTKQDSLVAQMGLPAMLSPEQKPINAVKNLKEVVSDDELTKEDLNAGLEAQSDTLSKDDAASQSIEDDMLTTNTLPSNDALASQALIAQTKVMIDVPAKVKGMAKDNANVSSKLTLAAADNMAKSVVQKNTGDSAMDATMPSMAAAVLATKSDVTPNADRQAKGLAQNVVSNDKAVQNSNVKATVSNANTAPDSKSNSFKAILANEVTLNDAANNDVTAANVQSNLNLNHPEFSATASTNVMATQVGKTDYIDTYFGKAGWSQAVNQQVMMMVGKGDESVTLTLNPPELGPLQVVLKIGNDQVDTTFISDNPEVRQALQDGMHHLKDKMNESGIQLGNTNISSNAQSQQDFQQAMQGREQANSSHHHQASIEAESIQVAPTMIKVQAAKGLVDTFA